jgi:hypothetical protein
MPERLKGRGQTKRSSWSSRLGVWLGANDYTQGTFTVMELWRRPRPTQNCNASKEEKEVYRME